MVRQPRIRDRVTTGRGEWLRLRYLAVDEHGADRAECEQVIERALGAGGKRWFGGIDDLRTAEADHVADVVVLCNVLHEIEPQRWSELFDKQSGLPAILKSDGSLLIVEDQCMPTGERAHAKGFLVLNTIALRKLFNSTSAEEIICYDQRGDGRLLAHAIPAGALGRVTASTMRAAIESVRDTARTKIKKLRKDSANPSFSQGLEHAFWTHQLANAELSLFELGPVDPKRA
jgi:hypothetical protein